MLFKFGSAQINELPEQMKGKVKSVFSRAYSAKKENGKLVADLPIYSYEYNFRKIFDENMNLKFQYNLGKDTNLLSVIEYKDEPIKRNKTFKVTDKDGKIIKRTICNCDQKMAPKYCISINNLSRERDTTISKYDESERIAIKTVKSSNPFLSQKIEYFYDKQSNIIELKVFDVKNSLTENYKNSYNNNNQRIEEFANFIKDSISKKNVFTYDDKGNITKTESFQTDGKPQSYWNFEYVYDITGNWTQMIVSKNDKPRMIVKRNFEYYK
jgi:hypothetical protein